LTNELTVKNLSLAFTFECMKSAREPVGLFLLAYFISFVPLIFIVVSASGSILLQEIDYEIDVEYEYQQKSKVRKMINSLYPEFS